MKYDLFKGVIYNRGAVNQPAAAQEDLLNAVANQPPDNHDIQGITNIYTLNIKKGQSVSLF